MCLQNKEKPVENTILETALLCRICGEPTFCAIDLGSQPFANALEDEVRDDVAMYPLKLHVCRGCSAGQLSYCADHEELYRNYLYVSPISTALNDHFGKVLDFLKENNYLSNNSNILEIGSNIGRFLEYIRPHVATILGIDPAVNIVRMANENKIPTINDFFNNLSAERILKRDGKKDIIIARHSFAHNEQPGLILEGIQKLLSDDGVFVVENAYFLDTVLNLEIDQVYHEHMYYYNLRCMSKLLDQHGLSLVDAYHSPIHGGSVIYVAKLKFSNYPVHDRVTAMLKSEKDMHREEFYDSFITWIERNKIELCSLMEKLLSEGQTIHVYGAAAKSTVLLNYYGIDYKTAPFAVDCTKIKHGKFLPGVNIMVISEEEALQNPPDYYLLTSWNYKDEIIKKVRSAGNHKTKFILPHPKVRIIR